MNEFDNMWIASGKAYASGWWKTRVNKEGQLRYMFCEGVRYAHRWIPVEDRDNPMPNDEDILIRLQDGSIRRYNEEWEAEFGLDGIVTHWMPMPKFD